MVPDGQADHDRRGEEEAIGPAARRGVRHGVRHLPGQWLPCTAATPSGSPRRACSQRTSSQRRSRRGRSGGRAGRRGSRSPRRSGSARSPMPAAIPSDERAAQPPGEIDRHRRADGRRGSPTGRSSGATARRAVAAGPTPASRSGRTSGSPVGWAVPITGRTIWNSAVSQNPTPGMSRQSDRPSAITPTAERAEPRGRRRSPVDPVRSRRGGAGPGPRPLPGGVALTIRARRPRRRPTG